MIPTQRHLDQEQTTAHRQALSSMLARELRRITSHLIWMQEEDRSQIRQNEYLYTAFKSILTSANY